MAEQDYMARFQAWLGKDTGREWLAEPEQHTPELLAARETLSEVPGLDVQVAALRDRLEAFLNESRAEQQREQGMEY